MMDWLLTEISPRLPMSPWEIGATVFGLASVWCYVRENVWSWPTGLVNVAMYIVLFWHIGLYAETGLQVVFVALQIYGWWQWVAGGERRSGVVISRTTPRTWAVLTIAAAAMYVPMGLALARWTTSTVPWWDSLPTVLSLIAQWMISKKKLENWAVWIAVDVISIPLFACKGLYLTAGVYAMFLALCIVGWRAWNRMVRARQAGLADAA